MFQMRKKIMNKKGMSLPAILGITTFLIGTVFVLTTIVLYQARALEADFKYQQEYTNAQQRIDATVDSIIENEDFSTEFLDDISAFMDVDISQYGSGTLRITSDLSNGSIVSSYLSDLSESISLIEEYFDYDGLENAFELSPFFTPSSLLGNYMNTFFAENFPSIPFVNDFDNIDDIVSYIKDFTDSPGSFTEVDASVLTDQNNPTVSGHWYIDGNVTLSNYDDLTIPEGYILFIDGDLTLKKGAVLTGNVVVNGDLEFDARSTYGTVEATVYTAGDFFTDDYMYLGTSSRPTFILSEGQIKFKKVVIGYAFLFSEEKIVFDRRGTYINIVGAAYSDSIKNLGTSEIRPNTYLDLDDLYGFAIIPEITTGTGNTTNYLYTNPK